MRLDHQVFAFWAAVVLLSGPDLGAELRAAVNPSTESGAVGVFHLGVEELSEVALSRPGCADRNCPWWLFGNTFGTAQKRTVGLVFKTVSYGPISARMDCSWAGCDGAVSMFQNTSDNFNEAGSYYCSAITYGGFYPDEICNMVAPGAYLLQLGVNFPFEAGEYLAGGFKTGGDNVEDAYLRVYDIHLIYEGPPPLGPSYFGADSNLENPLPFPRSEQELPNVASQTEPDGTSSSCRIKSQYRQPSAVSFSSKRSRT
jgi:hypothetical protein